MVVFSGLMGLLVGGVPAEEPSGSALHDQQAQKRPNIVFVLADDMGYGDARCYNPDSKVPTPAIDRLAREGIRFTDAHAPAAVCVPTRYGFMTGRYPFRTKLKWSGGSTIAADRVTLPSILKSAGYRTAMVGKWHLGFDGDPLQDDVELGGGPCDRGFDHYFGIPASLDIPPYYYVRDRRPIEAPTTEVAASATEGWTNIQGAFWRRGGMAPSFRHDGVLPRFTEEAERQIATLAAGDDPFFLYLALAGPHTPWLPSEEWVGKSGAGMYGDFVAMVDATVGRVLGALDEAGCADDTLVIFSSDNGPVWYPHDVERLVHASVGTLRGMKADAWEGGHRVPFLVRWPGRAPAGSSCDALVCFTDMLRTFAAITGADVPEGAGEDSLDVSALLRGETLSDPIRETLVLKSNGSVLREGRWKLITHLGSGGFSRPRKRAPAEGEPPGQLYDLSKDLGELHNLWAEDPERAERMIGLLKSLKSSAGSAPQR